MSSRTEHLNNIYNSIPYEQDITWHIARSSESSVLNGRYLLDNRVKVYELPCEDINTPCKMNFIFHKIIEAGIDSYFCIQDDDSHFHRGMYNTYKNYEDKKYMVIGRQIDKEGIIRLRGSLPYPCAIDAGNFLCHSSVLLKEPWPNKHWDNTFYADYDFANRAFKHFGIQKTDIVEDIISVYNAYSDKEDSLQYKRDI